MRGGRGFAIALFERGPVKIIPFADSPAGKYPDSRKMRIASVASISQITTSGAIRLKPRISSFLSFMICEIKAVSSQRIKEEVFPTRSFPCFFATSAIKYSSGCGIGVLEVFAKKVLISSPVLP